ncbi:TonB-dependent receptor [bacterium]|nr:TonB-dependent receptor [bacterium]
MRNGTVRFMLNLVITLVVNVSLWSGTTGKIAGIVTDQQTGEPLGGANVIVQGTEYGAAADLNGQFTILHIPPGTYNVVVSVIGYSKLTISDVQVKIDQTARMDVDLSMEAIEGEAVTIVADKLGIKPDVATSVVSVTSQEVEALPVSTVDGIVGMQAGVDGGLRIRGSEGDAVLYMVDGITMRDPRNNQPISKVALSAVKEINIERGGFNAEYGQVQSGLVNVVTYEGDRNSYFGSVTGKFQPPAPKYYRGNGIPDVHDIDSFWLRPYYDDDVCWTGTNNGAWDLYTRSKYPNFNGWNAVSEQLLSDNDPNNDLTPLGAQRVFMYQTRKEQPNDLFDYEIDAGFGGPVPFVSKPLGDLRFFTSYRRERDVLIWPQANPDYWDQDWTMQVTSNISESMKLRVSTLFGNISTLEENWTKGRYMRYPGDIAGGTGGNQLFNMFSDWAWSVAEISHRTFAANLTHTLNPQTFYEVSLEHLERDYFTHPTALRDTSTKYEIIPGYFVDEMPLGYWPQSTNGIEFGAGEQASLARDNSKTASTMLKASITSQVNFSNLVKAGAEFVYSDLDLDYGLIQMQTNATSYSNRVQMRNFPIRGAVYVQDKLETRGFTMNAGLRLDYSNSKTDWWDVDPYDPFFITSKYSADRVFTMKSTETQWQLSPRLGIAHPISENSKLYFNYGHFKQMPQYEEQFTVQRSRSGQLTELGDPNLTLAKTISYELGYDHVLLQNNLLLQLAAFYRDVSNQQGQTLFTSINNERYNLTTSDRYSDIRGFELTLRKTAGQWVSGFANYTYQVTSNGNFGEAEKYQDPAKQKQWNEETVNLYQTRPVPSPYARLNLNLYSPINYGPSFMGHSILGGFMTNILVYWKQGGWTTFNPKGASGINNNVQYVDDFNITLRAGKTIAFRKFRIQLLMDVGNLLNRLKLRDTGNQEYRLSLHLPKNKAYDNIPGDDKFGDYRKPGVEWQPMLNQAYVDRTKPPASDRPIYYESTTGQYWQYVEDEWTEVSQERLDQINEDKAYINMPGASTFWFVNPRNIVFGARISFDLN